MKKRVVLISSTILSVAVIATAGLALNHKSKPVSYQGQKSAVSSTTTTPTPVQSSKTAESTDQTQTTQAPTVTSTPSGSTSTTQSTSTPDQNKTEIMAVITSSGQSAGMNDSMIYIQTSCFDHIFTNANLYSNYDSLLNYPLMQKYLAGKAYFSGAVTCPVTYVKH